MQAVSPPTHFISLPFSSLFPPPLPQNVWIDLNGVIVTALPAVCLSASLESLTWAEGEKEGKLQSERGRGGKVLLNNKAWQLSRGPSLTSGVRLQTSTSIYLPSPLSFSRAGFINNLFLSEWPKPQLAVYGFLLWIDLPHSLLPLNWDLATLTGYLNMWGDRRGTEETKPPNLGLSFAQEVSHCVWGASVRCHMTWHSKSQGLRMWVIWSSGTKVCCLPMNRAFSYWHGEKWVNKHQRLGATLKCSAVFFPAPHLYKPVIT